MFSTLIRIFPVLVGHHHLPSVVSLPFNRLDAKATFKALSCCEPRSWCGWQKGGDSTTIITIVVVEVIDVNLIL
jgi:hypothetical protein